MKGILLIHFTMPIIMLSLGRARACSSSCVSKCLVFVNVSYRDPPISVCGCDSAPSQPEPQVCEFFSPLQPENATAECPDYSFNENSCASAWLACLLPSFPGVDFCDAIPILNRANIPGCSQLEPPTNATGSICNNTLPSCYSVDGLSADVLKVLIMINPFFTALITIIILFIDKSL